MDNAGDLSSGTLYVSKCDQTSDKNGGEFDISWIELGSATQEELVGIVDGLTFDKIFDVADPDGVACPDGFTYIVAGHERGFKECLKVKDGMEQAAAFFETRRYGAMLGGIAELKAFKGLAAVESTEKLYGAISSVTVGMGITQPKADFDGPDDIQLPNNPCGCGCVYEFDTAETADGWMAVTKARALVCGVPSTDDPDDKCNVESIANPDNLAYMGTFGSGIHSLLIAEDTSNHQNDYVWTYDLNSGTMTRILTSVYGSQVTGPAFFSDGLGCDLLMAIVPHPYKKSDQAMVNATGSIGLAGIVGYIGPIGSRV